MIKSCINFWTRALRRTGVANCCSISVTLFVNSSYVSANFQSETKLRMIAILISIALSLFNTLDSIATPCSVNAKGLAPPNLLFDGITDCETKLFISFSLNSNMKSSENLLLFLRTACFYLIKNSVHLLLYSALRYFWFVK